MVKISKLLKMFTIKKTKKFQFSLDHVYIFYSPHAHVNYTPGIVIGRPSNISDDAVLFHFAVGHKSLSEKVAKKEILAVYDRNGTVKMKNMTGTYRILNEKLFAKYVAEKIIVLEN